LQTADHSWKVTPFPWGARIEVTTAATNWFHIPITTPAVVNGINRKAVTAHLTFRTGNSATQIIGLQVWDGTSERVNVPDLILNPSAFTARAWTIPGSPTIESGIAVSVELKFTAVAPSTYVDLVAVGLDIS
jgi:hypothetical protein